MAVQRLESTNAFVVVDLDGAERADGVVRRARKVLLDSTRALARTRTYAWALLGERISGASAGISADDGDAAAAMAAFVSELARAAADGSLTLAAGKGVGPDQLDGLDTVVHVDPHDAAAGLLAVAETVAIDLGLADLGSTTVAVESEGLAAGVLLTALAERGAKVVAEGDAAPSTAADLLLCGSGAGSFDHAVAGAVPHRAVVPTSESVITPRGLAVATRRHITVVPEFLSSAGPLVRRCGDDPTERLATLTGQVLGREGSAVLAACATAEEFLATWREELPFGRPIG